MRFWILDFGSWIENPWRAWRLGARHSGPNLFPRKAAKAAKVIALLLLVQAGSCITFGRFASAQQIVGVDISKGKLQWTWTQGTGGAPSEFRAKCGTASGKYGTPVAQPFVAAANNTYAMAVSQALNNAPGTYFCVVTAANPAGESPPSNEISFFAGTVPAPATNLGVLAQ